MAVMLASLQNRIALESATSTKDDVTPSAIRTLPPFVCTVHLSHPAGRGISACRDLPLLCTSIVEMKDE